MKWLQRRTRQQGATLIIALVILLLMTVMASTALQSNALQSRMTANMQDQGIAFEAAETGLLYVEQWLDTQRQEPDVIEYDDWTAHSHLFVFDSRNDSSLQDQLDNNGVLTNWIVRAKSSVFYGAPSVQGVKQQPEISLELTDFQPDDLTTGYEYGESAGVLTYRNTSRNTGKTGNSDIVLVTNYKKRFR